MGDYIALAVIVIALAAAIIYIIRQKKKGAHCIGCPHSGDCASCGGCASKDEAE